MAKTIDILVGTPINDKKVSVDTGLTVAQVLADADINATGTTQHNGRTLSANQMGTSLKDLGFVGGDTLYIITKMDSATC